MVVSDDIIGCVRQFEGFSHPETLVVELGLSSVEAGGQQRLDRISSAVDVEVEFASFGGVESIEDEVGGVLAARGPAHPDANSVVVTGTDGASNRLEAVMAVVAAAELDPKVAIRDVELVMDDDQPVGV